jgi:hypothetical protein
LLHGLPKVKRPRYVYLDLFLDLVRERVIHAGLRSLSIFSNDALEVFDEVVAHFSLFIGDALTSVLWGSVDSGCIFLSLDLIVYLLDLL